MSRTNKGLSSVVGAVLLITISIGAATSAWTFIDTITQQTQQNIEERVEERGDEANSELSSEIAYNSTEGYTVITIRNTGSDTLRLENEDSSTLNMYVRGRPVDFTYLNAEKESLQPEETVTLNTTEKFPERDEDYSIEINGPEETSTTYICYNSGTASC
jgi:archaellum component FlaF (FlaF/FlaG flagellin family)